MTRPPILKSRGRLRRAGTTRRWPRPWRLAHDIVGQGLLQNGGKDTACCAWRRRSVLVPRNPVVNGGRRPSARMTRSEPQDALAFQLRPDTDAYPIYDRIPGHENAFVFAMHSAVSRLPPFWSRPCPTMSWASRCRRTGPSSGLPVRGGGSRISGSAASSPPCRGSEQMTAFNSFQEYGHVHASRGGDAALQSMLRLRQALRRARQENHWQRRPAGTRTPDIRASIL